MNNYGNLPSAQIFGGPNAQIYGGSNNTASAASSNGGVDWTSLLGGALGAGASIYGSQNAAEAAAQGNQAGINTQNQFLGNINGIYQPQYSLGSGAFNTLGSTLGTSGQPADYSNFMNMPGYQFAVQQGTQAIQRQAAANGTAYTPNTSDAIGQYVTGTAMQDYNTYVGQLMSAGGLGAQATQGLGNLTYGTGGNISQLQSNIGQNNAGKYSGVGGALGSLFGGANGSGIIGNIAKGVGSLFSSGGGGGAGTAAAGTNPASPNYQYGSGVNPWTGQSTNPDPTSSNYQNGSGVNPWNGQTPTTDDSGAENTGISGPQ